MDKAEVATKVGQARWAYAQKARDHSWTQRTEVKVNRETKTLKTEIVRSTVAGKLRKLPIDGTTVKKPRGVRGKDGDAWYFDVFESFQRPSRPRVRHIVGGLQLEPEELYHATFNSKYSPSEDRLLDCRRARVGFAGRGAAGVRTALR